LVKADLASQANKKSEFSYVLNSLDLALNDQLVEENKTEEKDKSSNLDDSFTEIPELPAQVIGSNVLKQGTCLVSLNTNSSNVNTFF